MLFSKSRSRSGFWKKKKKKKKPAVVQISTCGFGIFSEVVPPRSARSPICQNKHFSKKKSSVPCACSAAKLREVAYSSVASPEYFIVKIWEVKLMTILYWGADFPRCAFS